MQGETGFRLHDSDKILPIHTHDRIAFRRCRRKWNWTSPLRSHLEPIEVGDEQADAWFGTGFHFALEDFHGWKRFSHPAEAFGAYCKACHAAQCLPDSWEEYAELAIGMLDYYATSWLKNRNIFQTLWLDGQPQVEVQFSIEIPELTQYVREVLGKEEYVVVYQGTFDRIVVDEEGRYWVEDYKTRKTISTSNLETDPQISAYAWAAEWWYQRPIEGVILMQFLKDVPKPPRTLKSGNISLDKRQRTTYDLARTAMLEVYRDPSKFPQDCLAFLNELLDREQPEGNGFIRYDKVYKNDHQKEAEYMHIIAEGYEMLNAEIIYPNPTRDCSWDCVFRSACLATDDGSDADWFLDNFFRVKRDEPDWRRFLTYPDN